MARKPGVCPSGFRNLIRLAQFAGYPVNTNLSVAPYFASVAGAQVVERNPSGHIILRIAGTGGNAVASIAMTRQARCRSYLGRAAPLLALVFLAATLIACLGRRLRSGHSYAARDG